MNKVPPKTPPQLNTVEFPVYNETVESHSIFDTSRPMEVDELSFPQEREPSKTYSDTRFQSSTNTGHTPLLAAASNVRATKKATVPGTAPKTYYGKYGSSKPIPQKV